MPEKFLHFSLNVETEKKYKEKVSTTVLTAIFIENSYRYKYSLKLFPILSKKNPNNYETSVQTNNSYGCDNFEKMSIMN